MWAPLIAWGDRHGYAASLLVRVLAPVALGVVIGLVIVVVAAVGVWTVRELRWTRRMQQEIRRSWDGVERKEGP